MMKNYRSSGEDILQSVWQGERAEPAGLNGFYVVVAFRN